MTEEIEIENHLKVQGYGRKGGNRYTRITLPFEVTEEKDIRPGDLVKVTIVEHIKVGRKQEGEEKTLLEKLREKDRREQEEEDAFEARQLHMTQEQYEKYKKSAKEYDNRKRETSTQSEDCDSDAWLDVIGKERGE